MAAATSALAPAAKAADSARQLELTWDAPAECPDERQVRAQVEALLPNDSESPPQSLQANAQVVRGDAGGWLLHLTLKGERSQDERELVGDSCQALVDSVAVMLALQLNPTGDDTQPAPAPAPVARTPPPKPPRRALREPSPRPRAHFQLGLSYAAETAALPRVAPGVHAEAGWASHPWYVGVGAGSWLSQQRSLAAERTGQARFGFRTLSLAACHAGWGGAVRLGPCVSAELGQLSAQSSKVREAGEVQELWVAALAGVAFWAPLGSSLFLTSNLSAVVPLRRPHFVIEGIGEIHQARPLGARSALGLAVRF